MENYVNRQLSDKSMKFDIMVVHYLTNDMSYNAKLNRSKICFLGGKIVKKNYMLKIARNCKICVVSIFVDILV